MFKQIVETNKRTSLIVDAFEEVTHMIERAERMFDAACTAFMSDQERDVDISAEDRAINEGERMIRRLVTQHLTINPTQDLPASLALFSIVHDVERIGDYAKSLSELCQWQSDSEGSDAGRQLQKKIAPLFGQLLQALRDEDVDAARQVMRTHEEVKIACDTFVTGAFQDEASNRHTVVQVMAVRFLRRISAHLSNVASSVVNPLDRIGGKEQE